MNVKYNKIGANYNLTRKADKYLSEQLSHHLKAIEQGLYLDIGCGTGNYTDALSDKGLSFVGIDPSSTMLEKAKLRNDKVQWKIGTAEKTGLPDCSINGIVASLTIHHWTDITCGFKELNRVLKPGGRIVVFTSTPKQMKGYWLNHYFPKMLSDSMLQMPGLDKLTTAVKASSFEVLNTSKYFIKEDLQDQFLYCGKHNPELYFDKQIRNGISSFSALANQKEVEAGLSNLRKDITSGKIRAIIDSYQNDLGDYLFVVGKKVISSDFKVEPN